MGFIENNHCVIPNEKVQNCLKYKSNGVCKECQLNYGLKNGMCQKIKIKDCLRTTTDDLETCEICSDNILPENGQCKNKDKKCTIEDCEHCEEAGGLEICSFCKAGFYLLIERLENEDPMFFCEETRQRTENCLYSTDLGKCMECKLNYYMNKESFCVKSRSYQEEMYGSFMGLS